MKIRVQLVVLLFLMAVQAMSQSVTYAYDANGNRTSRQVTVGSNKSITTNDVDSVSSPLYDAIDTYDIKIYPNPTYGMLRVDVSPLPTETFSIEVYDMNGRSVCRIVDIGNINSIDLTSCQKGMYIMVFQSGSEKRTWKIIKK